MNDTIDVDAVPDSDHREPPAPARANRIRSLEAEARRRGAALAEAQQALKESRAAWRQVSAQLSSAQREARTAEQREQRKRERKAEALMRYRLADLVLGHLAGPPLGADDLEQKLEAGLDEASREAMRRVLARRRLKAGGGH